MMVSALARALPFVLAISSSVRPVQADPSVLATLQGGVVEGVVYDSTQARPLSGARVFLWNTQMFATADVHGVFRIEDVPPGDYDLVFFHPRLTALGVSSGRTPVTVQEGDRVSISLTTPSMPTIMGLLCMAEDPLGERGRAVGYVGDASTGVAFPGAQVIVEWRENTALGPVHQSAQGEADSEGWYSLCSLPPDTEIEGRAFFLGKETHPRRFSLDAGVPARIDFTMGSVRPGRITGHLIDAQTGHAIPDAEVLLVDTEFRTVTDGNGQFELHEIPPGPYALKANHIAYENRAEGISIEPGADLRIRMDLATEPIPLDPIEVIVRSEGEIRAEMVGGRLISPAEVEEVRARSTDMGDLLTHENVPGLFVVRDGTRVCVGFRRGQVTMGMRGECVPAQVYINDVPTSDPSIALNLAAEVVDRIIVVPPVEAGVMFKVGSSTGVIMVYTRTR